MHCVFDGSFDGLMTLAFDTYRQREQVAAVSAFTGADSLLPTRYFPCSAGKAMRIKRFLHDRVGPDFASMVREAFLSCREGRFRAIVRTIHLSCALGPRVTSLLDEEVLLFLACHREVGREAHRFMGLLRFRVMQDGTMLAVFAPRHDVLTLVLPHFMSRFPDERLLLYDEGRHLAGLAAAGRAEFLSVESLTPQDAGDEQELQALWRTFFHALAIPERRNPRLQQQHVPRYTWRNLTEMQG